MQCNVAVPHQYFVNVIMKTSEGPPGRALRPRRQEEAAAPVVVDAISDTNTLVVIGIVALIAWIAEYLKVFSCTC